VCQSVASRRGVAMSFATFGSTAAPPPAPLVPNFTLVDEEQNCGAGEQEAPQVWTYILGILLGISASVGINVGNNVQALGLAQQQKAGEEKRNKLFWFGTWTFVLASIVNFAAFGLAPAAVLAPLESVQFVSNLLFARFVNHMNVTRRMVGGSSLIVFGTILAIAFGPSRVLQFSVDDLVGFWTGTDWVVYLILNFSLFLVTQSLHIVYERADVAGKDLPYAATIRPVTFGLSSALLGSHCVVQAKCMSELFEIFLLEPGCILAHWFFYMTLILLFFFLYQWLTRLSIALRKYNPIFIIPLLQSNYILFSTVTGGIFFTEFTQLTEVGWGCFFTGILIMFIGLYFLAPVTSPEDEEDAKVHPDPDGGSSTTHASPPSTQTRQKPPVEACAESTKVRAPGQLPKSPINIVEVSHVSDDGVIHADGVLAKATAPAAAGPLVKPANLTELAIPTSVAATSLASAPATADSSFTNGHRDRRCSKDRLDFSGIYGGREDSRPPSGSVEQNQRPSSTRPPQAVGALGAVVMMRQATPVVQDGVRGGVAAVQAVGEVVQESFKGVTSLIGGAAETVGGGAISGRRTSISSGRTGRRSMRASREISAAEIGSPGNDGIAYYNDGEAQNVGSLSRSGSGQVATAADMAQFRRITEESLVDEAAKPAQQEEPDQVT